MNKIKRDNLIQALFFDQFGELSMTSIALFFSLIVNTVLIILAIFLFIKIDKKEEEINIIKVEYNQELDEIKEEIEYAQQAKEQITTLSKEYEDISAKYENALFEIETYKKELKDLNEKISNINVDITSEDIIIENTNQEDDEVQDVFEANTQEEIVSDEYDVIDNIVDEYDTSVEQENNENQ